MCVGMSPSRPTITALRRPIGYPSPVECPFHTVVDCMYTGIRQDGAMVLDKRAAAGMAEQFGMCLPVRPGAAVRPLEVVRCWPANWPMAVLHSGRFHRQWARWSVLARPAGRLTHVGGRTCRQHLNTEVTETAGPLTHAPLDDLVHFIGSESAIPRDAAYHGVFPRPVWIGSLSYELGEVIEPAAAIGTGTDHTDVWPVYEWQRCPDVLVYDHAAGEWWALPGTDEAFVNELMQRAERGATGRGDGWYVLGPWDCEWTRQQYEDRVGRVIEYIRAGDIFQANLTQRMNAAFDGSTRALFMDAMEHSEPWYAAYLELGRNRQLISLSPELFLTFDAGTRLLTTRPIKGTLPSHLDAQALAASAKDAAELNMIVDLMRNDLGRVCEFGSVEVVGGGRAIESHPTVYHGVATVQGRVREGLGMDEVLRATFPAGSITGAPKIRAMQIIRELEGQQRGPFFGSVGVVWPDGSFTFNVSIRTMVVEGGCAQYAAGGGIVADSVPGLEYEEMLAKTVVVEGLVTRE